MMVSEEVVGPEMVRFDPNVWWYRGLHLGQLVERLVDGRLLPRHGLRSLDHCTHHPAQVVAPPHEPVEHALLLLWVWSLGRLRLRQRHVDGTQLLPEATSRGQGW
jgi:hypothetical protein